MSEKILCVDDDPNILFAFRRQLRKQFQVETASGAAEGLETIASDGPFAVVVSDMRMPGMDGVQFLSAVRQRTPDSVRIMLTGNADQQTAMDAVNEGQIFRFLTKPCPSDTLAATLAAGVRQYQLVTAEKELLEKTLRGSVKVLTDVLSLTNPTAFGRATRVRKLVKELCGELKVDRVWEYEIAAMLSQIGCVTIPSDMLERVYDGRELNAQEAEMFESHPATGRDLVANIPRLENVAAFIAHQQRRYDGAGSPARTPRGDDIPRGARVLKVALDFDTLRCKNLGANDAFVEMNRRAGWYDPFILAALEVVIGFDEPFELRTVKLYELTTNMVLDEDVVTRGGALLVGRGQEVTATLRQRLMNFAQHRQLHDSVRVLVRSARRSAATSCATGA